MTHEDLKKQDDADVRALLRTREGARFFARLLELTRVFEISYIPHDAHGTAFNEGVRNVGLAVYEGIAEAGGLGLVQDAALERRIER